MDTDATAADYQVRSGTAARLAGLPVTTLRVWERRYQVVAATRSEGGQRVYSPQDVARLRLLRKLTLSGHAIGTIAALELEALQRLAQEAAQEARPGTGSATAVVVGRLAAVALEGISHYRIRLRCEDLDQAGEAPPPEGAVGLLAVQLASLQPGDVPRVLALGARLQASAVLVIYGFGTQACANLLRDAGVVVCREPVDSRELAVMLRRATGFEPGAAVEQRRFSDDMLARLMSLPSPVACECLRHVAEIVAQLAGFEQYSADCAAHGDADTALHAALHRTAGSARTLFEKALADLMGAEQTLRALAPAEAGQG